MAQKKKPLVTARIDRMVNQADNNIKAYASANVAGAFAIHGIKVINSTNGPFVQMPNVSYKKDGEIKYKDVFHAITAEARTELNDAVLKSYEERLHMDEAEKMSEQPDEDVEAAFSQSM